jgi:hypothetical protein
MRGEYEKLIKDINREAEKKRPLEKSKRRWKNNIKVALTEISFDGVE